MRSSRNSKSPARSVGRLGGTSSQQQAKQKAAEEAAQLLQQQRDELRVKELEAETFAREHDAERDANDREQSYRINKQKHLWLEQHEKEQVKALQSELARAREQHEKKIDELESEIAERDDKIRHSAKNSSHAVNWYQERLRSVERERDSLLAENAKLLQEQLMMLKQKNEPSAASESAIRIRCAELQIEAEHLRNELADGRRQVEERDAQVEQAREDVAKAQAETESVRAEFVAFQLKVAEKEAQENEEISQLKAQVQSQQMHIDDMTTDEKLRARVVDLEFQLREAIAMQITMQTKMETLCSLGSDQFFEISPERTRHM